MQIDMHYYGVYAIARLAGLRPEAARTIATASQYVDDAVEADIQPHEKGNKLSRRYTQIGLNTQNRARFLLFIETISSAFA